MSKGTITTKQRLYLVGLQRTEREPKVVRGYLKPLGKATLNELTKEEALELIGMLIDSSFVGESLIEKAQSRK